MEKVILEKTIRFIWFSVAMSFCWPLPLISSKKQIVAYKLLQIGGMISVCMVLLPFMYSLYLHFDNIVIRSKCICMLIGISQSIIQSIICFVKHNVLQRVVAEMVTCVKESQQFEKKIYFDYVTKYNIFYGCFISFTYFTAGIILLGPVVLSAPFPYDIEYPFVVNSTLTYTLLYLHQFFFTFQCTAHICLSGFGALLLWFTTARFECLAAEFQKCSDVDAITYINKHIHLRRYAKDVISCLRYIVLYAIMVSTFVMTLCGLLLITNAPLIVKIQFIFVCFTVLTEIYMYAWPADYMTDMSINASRSVYHLSWYEHSLRMQKNILNMLMYQKPVVLSVSCVLPQLSLRYFCSYLSNAFSIFASLRAAVEGN